MGDSGPPTLFYVSLLTLPSSIFDSSVVISVDAGWVNKKSTKQAAHFTNHCLFLSVLFTHLARLHPSASTGSEGSRQPL